MPPRFTQVASALPSTVPFVGPETRERETGRPFKARLGANESVFGPSAEAIRAMERAARDAWMYGDPENHDIKTALAEFHGVRPENIVVGEGIDGLLGYLARLFIEPGDIAVTSDGAYPTFNYHVSGFGGALAKVPYDRDREDLPGLVAKARETGAKLVYLANPDNPMGTWIEGRVLAELLEELPDDAVLALDEAYVEFAPKGAAPPIDVERPNVIRFRTFSKAYGLAGARIGYAIGHADLVGAFDKVRNHFGVNRIAQAGALAALSDAAHLDMVVGSVDRAREEIVRIAGSHGLETIPSAANFVAIDCGRDGAFARRVLAGLVSGGIFVRMPLVAPQDRCVRIAAGTEADLERFAAEFGPALEAAASAD